VELPVAVLGVLGEETPDVPPGGVAAEGENAVLVLDHHLPLCGTSRYGHRMSSDPRGALNRLVAAFERHLEASSARHGEDDPAVIAAYDDLSEAFEAYDALLYEAYQEMTPLVVYGGPDDEDDSDDDSEDDDDSDDDDSDDDDSDDDDSDDDDDFDDEGDDDDGVYAGLDAEEFEETDRDS
jgi:hypothetical protein